MKLTNCFAALTNIDPLIKSPSQSSEIIITGDAHASFAIWLVPLLQEGHIALAKNETLQNRQKYLRRLDQIITSTYIDELKITGKKLAKFINEQKRITESSTLIEGDSVNIPLKQVKEQFNLLRALILKELQDFDTIMSKFTLENPSAACKLIDMGDSCGDRGNCDVYMFKACMMLTRIGVNFSSIFSNHTLETLYALLTDSWDINTPPAFILRENAEQIRSLNNFRTLLHYKLISHAEKDEMLSHWAQHIKLMAYSYPDGSKTSTNIYTHAPVGIQDIIDLATNYCGISDAKSLLAAGDKSSSEFHEKMRTLIDQMCEYFRVNFFTKKTAQTMQMVVQASQNRQTLTRDPESISMFYLCDFSMRDQPLKLNDCPFSFTFYHGHRTQNDIYEDTDETPPQNQVSLDNDYFKPTAPGRVEYKFTQNQYLTPHDFSDLKAQSMINNILYYTLNAGVWSYKGKCNQAMDDYNTIRKTLPHYFFTTIEAELTCCFSFFSSYILPESPVCRLSRLFYTEESELAKKVEVPILCKNDTETFSNVFASNEIDISCLLRRGTLEIERGLELS